MKIPIVVLNENARIPQYAHADDSGMDIYASEDVLIRPSQTLLVPTGIAVAIPNGYEFQIRPRSGLSLKTMLRLPNSPGTIDAGYRDEIKVIIHNASICDPEKDDQVFDLDVKDNPQGIYRIRKGDRIAQMVLAQVEHATFDLHDTLEGIGTDRNGGFGSTGVL